MNRNLFIYGISYHIPTLWFKPLMYLYCVKVIKLLLTCDLFHIFIIYNIYYNVIYFNKLIYYALIPIYRLRHDNPSFTR